MSKIIYIDMDEVIADFSGSKDLPKGKRIWSPPQMFVPGFFLNLEPIRGSHEVIHQLIGDGYNVQILTQPVATSATSYTEKAQWIAKHFPVLSSKINMTQDKGLFRGDFLIDDNLKWKEPFEKNGGKFLHFNMEVDPEYMWKTIYEMITYKEEPNDRNLEATSRV